MDLLQNNYPYFACTSEQCRELDEKTISEFGIDGFTLMETAAMQAARFIGEREGINKRGLFICGKGNNAGDALAAVRYLVQEYQHQAVIFFVSGHDDLSDDADKNYRHPEKLKTDGYKITFINEPGSLSDFDCDYITDGMLGTGLSSPLRSGYLDTTEWINRQASTIYAIDIPTGISADNGEILGDAVRADYTLTFGVKKTGFLFNGGKSHTGEIIHFKLPFSRSHIRSDGLIFDETWLDQIPEIKRKGKHKYDKGVVHVLAGSEGLTGAAIMACKSAWNTGAGAVILYAPKQLLPVYECTIPEIIKVPLGSNDDAFYKNIHTPAVLEMVEKRGGTLLVGPGIGLKPETKAFVLEILRSCEMNTILDADGLSVWQEFKDDPGKQKLENMILTPHPGEANNYLDADFKSDFERLKWTKNFTSEYSCAIFSKGNPAIFGYMENAYISGYDTTIFSRAGFGDVLSGTIAANLAISGNIELSVIRALLEGYKKAKLNKEPVSPRDIL